MFKQRYAISVLLCYLSVRRTLLAQFFLPSKSIAVFSPLYKILGSSPASAIQNLVRLDCEDELGILEQLRYVFWFHISDILVYALRYVYTRLFAFDYNDRNTVAHKHNVRTSIFPVTSLNAELLCNLPNILLGMNKIYVLQIKRPLDRLELVHDYPFFDTYAQSQKIVYFLASHSKTLQKRCIKLFYRLVDRLIRKRSFKSHIIE